MIFKKNNYFPNLDNKIDNGNKNPLFEDLSDKMCKHICSYDQIRQSNLNFIINEPKKKKLEIIFI